MRKRQNMNFHHSYIPGIFDVFHPGHRYFLTNAIKPTKDKMKKNRKRNFVIGIYTDECLHSINKTFINSQEKRFGDIEKFLHHELKNYKIIKKQTSSLSDKKNTFSFAYSEITYQTTDNPGFKDTFKVFLLPVNDFDDEEKITKKYEIDAILCGKGHVFVFDDAEEDEITEYERLSGFSTDMFINQSHPFFITNNIVLCDQKHSYDKFISNSRKDYKITKLSETGFRWNRHEYLDEDIILILNSHKNATGSKIAEERKKNEKMIFDICNAANEKKRKCIMFYHLLDFENENFLIQLVELKRNVEQHRKISFPKIFRYEDDLYDCGPFRIHKKKLIIEGAYGKLYETNRKKIVAKVISVQNVSEFFYECKMSQIASNNDFGPKIYFYYYSPWHKKGVILMDEWMGDITDIILTYDDAKELLKIIKKMHSVGIFHHDLYSRNILYRNNRKTKEKEFSIIDYGMSFLLKETPLSFSDEGENLVPQKLQLCDIISLLYGKYDSKALRVEDGLNFTQEDDAKTQNELQNHLFKYLVPSFFSMEDWLEVIRWRVIRNIDDDGRYKIPEKKEIYLDVLGMYEYLLSVMNPGNVPENLPYKYFKNRFAYIDYSGSDEIVNAFFKKVKKQLYS